MPLELHPITEADFPDFVRIQFDAFQGGIAGKLMQDRSPEAQRKSVEKQIKCYQEEKDCHFIKVIDTDLDGKLIAGGKWRINEKERTEEEIEIMIPTPGPEQEGNQGAIDFMDYLSEARRKWMGTKPFYFLHLLATDREHQKRGAGGMLIRWGLEKADRAQLPSFLESTDAGYALYSSFGFKDVQRQVFDLSKYGGQGTATNTAMIRDPQPAN